MDIVKFMAKLTPQRLSKAFVLKEQIDAVDMGVLKVAFMVAALDGDVTEAEYTAFERLAKKCRGYSEESAARALDEALRSAGYLMLLARRVTEADLAKAFVAEAKAALPKGFANYTIEDVRRAFVMWIAMGLADGSYSARERKCIEALRHAFAEMKVTRLKKEHEREMMLSPAFRQAYGMRGAGTKVELVSKDFVSQVEEVAATFDGKGSTSKALALLIGAK